jgi:hypothetical protein
MEAVPKPTGNIKSAAALLFFCFGGAVLNVYTGEVFRDALGVPLFMDTLFTVAMSFYGGPLYGVLTGLLTNPITNIIHFYGWADNLYALCGAAAALITVLFIRLFPRELRFGAEKAVTTGESDMRAESPFRAVMNILVALLLLSFVMCVAMSILGGLITVLINAFSPPFTGSSSPSPERLFKLALLRKDISPVFIEILSRTPLNIIDRLLSVFGGYGAAVLLHRVRRRISGY